MINLIFDMDGCLIDSTDVQKSAFYGSYKEIVGDDKCPDFSEYLKHTGDSLPNIFRKMGLPVEMAGPYRRISCEAVDKINVNYDCVNLIREMREKGSKVAICTGKDHYRTVDILKFYGIDDCFDVIVASDDVKNPKPSPDSALQSASELGVNANTCLMIGDGYNDLLCAKNAGIRSILTLWYGDVGVPRDADYVVKTVEELREVLLNEINK